MDAGLLLGMDTDVEAGDGGGSDAAGLGAGTGLEGVVDRCTFDRDPGAEAVGIGVAENCADDMAVIGAGAGPGAGPELLNEETLLGTMDFCIDGIEDA